MSRIRCRFVTDIAFSRFCFSPHIFPKSSEKPRIAHSTRRRKGGSAYCAPACIGNEVQSLQLRRHPHKRFCSSHRSYRTDTRSGIPTDLTTPSASCITESFRILPTGAASRSFSGRLSVFCERFVCLEQLQPIHQAHGLKPRLPVVPLRCGFLATIPSPPHADGNFAWCLWQSNRYVPTPFQ